MRVSTDSGFDSDGDPDVMSAEMNCAVCVCYMSNKRAPWDKQLLSNRESFDAVVGDAGSDADFFFIYIFRFLLHLSNDFTV